MQSFWTWWIQRPLRKLWQGSMRACLLLWCPDFDSSMGEWSVVSISPPHSLYRKSDRLRSWSHPRSVCTSEPKRGCPSSGWLHDSSSIYKKSGRLATHWWTQRHVIIAVIHQGYLALEITNIIFDALSELHFDREKVIVVLLKLLSGSVLVIEGLLHLFETPKTVP